MAAIDPQTLELWQGRARRDDWHMSFVGSDIRVMLGEIERLRGEVKQCSTELGEAAKLLRQHYPRTSGIYEEACGRARIAIGLTPCDVEQALDK